MNWIRGIALDHLEIRRIGHSIGLSYLLISTQMTENALASWLTMVCIAPRTKDFVNRWVS
jgi:hypothetical protein